MANKSEELAKLLGVYKCFCTEGEQPYTTDDKMCELCDTDYKKCWSRLQRYPDFTEPSNFVKLLEDIKIDGIELCDWLIAYQGGFCNRENFIKKLILTIKQDSKCLNTDIKIIKQKARQVNWEY